MRTKVKCPHCGAKLITKIRMITIDEPVADAFGPVKEVHQCIKCSNDFVVSLLLRKEVTTYKLVEKS